MKEVKLLAIMLVIALLPFFGCQSNQATKHDKKRTQTAPKSKASNLPDAAHENPRFHSLWNYNDPKETRKAFLALAQTLAEKEHTQVIAELETQIARTFSLQNAFDDAHQWLDKAKSLIGEKRNIALVRLLLERGRTFNSANMKTKAIPLFKRAYELAKTLENADYHTIDAAHMIAIAENENALEWNLKALALAKAAENVKAAGWQGSLLNNIAWTFAERKEYEKALTYFEESRAFFEQANKPQAERIARWSIANMHRKLGNHAKALSMQRGLEKELETLKTPDGFVFEELALLYQSMGQATKASAYATKALEALGKMAWFTASHPERIETLEKMVTPESENQ